MRAVLDVNVIIAAVLAPARPPAKLFRAWLQGEYELVVSAHLLEELERALAYPKLRKRVSQTQAEQLADLLRRGGEVRHDPAGAPPLRSPDPGDDYVIALAASARAVIVSGDAHLLGLGGGDFPVYTPAAFLELLEAR